MSETYQAINTLGGIDVRVARSTQGVSVEIEIKRPREPGETYEDVSAKVAVLAIATYKQMLAEMATVGLVPGKEPRS